MKRKNLSSLNNPPIPKKKKDSKYCRFCKFKIKYVDYKDTEMLKRFVNPQVKILPPVYTGNCAKHQKIVANAIKVARELALIPYVADNYN